MVHSKFQDLVAKPMEDEDKLQRPDEDDIAEVHSLFIVLFVLHQLVLIGRWEFDNIVYSW